MYLVTLQQGYNKSLNLTIKQPFLQPAAAATGGGSALNDLVDLNFGGGAPAQVKTQLH